MSSQVSKNIPENVAGNSPKSDLFKNIPKENGGRFKKILERLNLQGIESWMDQQRQSAKDLIIEYQHFLS